MSFGSGLPNTDIKWNLHSNVNSNLFYYSNKIYNYNNNDNNISKLKPINLATRYICDNLPYNDWLLLPFELIMTSCTSDTLKKSQFFKQKNPTFLIESNLY